MGSLAPPRVYLSWTASSLTTAFGGYRVYRRPARAAVAEWELIAEITVPGGRNPATVEAQHTKFIDYEAGWAGATASKWSDGWDYAVTALDKTTGLEQSVSAGVSAQQVPSDDFGWITSNRRPWNGFPLKRAHRSFKDQSGFASDPVRVAGRDQVTTRTRLELPAREQEIEADFFSQDGEDPLRYWRAMAASGERACLHLPLGDRVLGTLDTPSGDENSDAIYLAVKGDMVETRRLSAVADFNLPCGIVTDGSTDYVSVADSSSLDPSGSAFTVVFCGALSSTASKYAFTKGNIGTAAGYGFHTNAESDELVFTVTGTNSTMTCTNSSAAQFDGYPHVAVGVSTGTNQSFYVDGVAVKTAATVHGSVSNAVALVMGGNNGGATDGMVLTPGIAFAVYMRALTATEAQAASYYLLGYPGYRMPYGPAVFVDLRDDRCWNGAGTVVKDLSGNQNHGTVVSSPATRGIPWPLSELERFG